MPYSPFPQKWSARRDSNPYPGIGRPSCLAIHTTRADLKKNWYGRRESNPQNRRAQRRASAIPPRPWEGFGCRVSGFRFKTKGSGVGDQGSGKNIQPNHPPSIRRHAPSPIPHPLVLVSEAGVEPAVVRILSPVRLPFRHSDGKGLRFRVSGFRTIPKIRLFILHPSSLILHPSSFILFFIPHPSKMVPGAGVEPAVANGTGSEPVVSANSTTPGRRDQKSGIRDQKIEIK